MLSAPVLVLNANYEPLNVCTTKRALVLIFSDKASLIKNGRGYIKTVSSAYPAPSIIRLDEMIKRPRPAVKLSKSEVFRRDDFTCQYCGKRAAKLTIDHVIPRHLGGAHSWENLVAACPACNHKKGGKTPTQAQMNLINNPYRPNSSAEYRFGRYLRMHQDWLPFVKGW
ncbi:MAG: HNH endonuclease [Anaerolineales bacterium]|nr:HNH endonuclease [Anaerolineales bacterium]